MFVPIETTELTLRPPSSGISQKDWDVLSKFWYPVAHISEVKDAPFKGKLLDVDLVLFESGSGITVALDMCPHRWVRLSAGEVKDGNIVCPFHGMAFDGTGKCTRIPALGETSANLPENYRVKTFRTESRYGMVWICLDDDSSEHIPSYPCLEGCHASAIMFVSIWQWPISAARQMENFFDLGHLPFVHATTLGGDPMGKLKPARIEEREKSLLFTARFVETVPFDKPTECELVYEVFLPFSIAFSSTPAGGTGFKSIDIASPTSAHSCRVFQIAVRGEPGEVFDGEEDFPVYQPDDGAGEINQQDIDVLQHLVIKDIPLTEKLEVHLPVDNVGSAYRRKLRDLGLGQS